MNNLYFNTELVDEYGLAPGDSFSSKAVIGTSLPREGVLIESNDSMMISICIGSDLFSS